MFLLEAVWCIAVVLKTFWLQDPFTVLKVIEDFPKRFYFSGLFLLIFTILEMKMFQNYYENSFDFMETLIGTWRDLQGSLDRTLRIISVQERTCLWAQVWKSCIWILGLTFPVLWSWALSLCFLICEVVIINLTPRIAYGKCFIKIESTIFVMSLSPVDLCCHRCEFCPQRCRSHSIHACPSCETLLHASL